MTPETSELFFVVVGRCRNAMEQELYAATLREKEIPHRSQTSPDGIVILLVPKDWVVDARTALDNANQVFFLGQGSPSVEERPTADPTPFEAPRSSNVPKPELAAESRSTAVRVGEEEEGEAWESPKASHFGQQKNLQLELGLPHPEDLIEWPKWPVRILCAVPGLGLGHLYIGNVGASLALFSLSTLGFFGWLYLHRPWFLLFVLFAWCVDFLRAPRQVRLHNQQARRLRKVVERREQELLKALGPNE